MGILNSIVANWLEYSLSKANMLEHHNVKGKKDRALLALLTLTVFLTFDIRYRVVKL